MERHSYANIYNDLWIFFTDMQIAHPGSNLDPISMTNLGNRHRLKIKIITVLIPYSTIILTKQVRRFLLKNPKICYFII
jgi:hypothetical protein